MATRRSSFDLTARVLAVTLALATLTVVLAAPAGAQDPPLRVLILGDSYSAGNGAQIYYGPTGCYRSRYTWGELAAAELGERSGREVKVTNRACSGGVTTHLTGGDATSDRISPRKLRTVTISQGQFANQATADSDARARCARYKSSDPLKADESWAGRAKLLDGSSSVYVTLCDVFVEAQITQVTDQYDVVFFTTGGNDVSFSGIGTNCLAEFAPGSIKDRNADRCDDNLSKAKDMLASTSPVSVRANIDRATRMIDTRLNPAGLLSYPYLIKNNDYEYQGVKVGSRLRRISDLGDAVQRDVTGLANRTTVVNGCARKSVVFADETKANFGDHSPTAPISTADEPNSWLWEVRLPFTAGTSPTKDSLHPKPAGHLAEATTAVEAAVASGVLPSECAQTVFILNRGDNGYEGANLQETLQGQGAVVDRAAALPADISAYRSVWVVTILGDLTELERATLTQYVSAGGSLFLPGERPCCEAINDSTELIVNQVVRGGGISIGNMGDILGPYSVNPNAAGRIAVSPQLLTAFIPNGPGGMAGLGGVTDRNVFVSNGTIPVAGVWDETDMVSGRGRLVVIMDVNWLNTASRSQYSVNVLEFLSDRA
ncbi:MAG: SGNH/GDSL hydrolase family protein [Actinobacteria bacterium]|nr:SGNH/GDSL hydrolase family protein [Actinomycetota bacterium]